MLSKDVHEEEWRYKLPNGDAIKAPSAEELMEALEKIYQKAKATKDAKR